VAGAETPSSMAEAIVSTLNSGGKTYDTYRLNAWERAKSLQWDQILPPACDWLEDLARGNSRPARR
jgi:hypothetical protein